MKTFEQWMQEYGVSHQNPTNQLIHKVCVPLIMFSVIGLLYSISTIIALIVVVLSLAFYASLNFKYFMGMLIQSALMLALIKYIDQTVGILLTISIIIFVISWAFQFIGHKIEGKKPSFLQDLAFLLIGPLWVLRFLYQKLGI
jgi:uncharacterized membrane protein YGL010W